MVWCGSMMMAAPLTARAELELVAGVDIGLVPFARRRRTACAAPASAISRAPRVAACSLNLAPPPTASTDTASTTICLVRSMKPKRALCAFSKARCIAGSAARRHHQRRVGAGIANMRAHEDLDLARRHALAGDFRLRLLAEPRALALDARRAPWRRTAVRSPAGASRGCRRAPCRRPTAATRTDGSAPCVMPSASATRQACWPPAPPKQLSA